MFIPLFIFQILATLASLFLWLGCIVSCYRDDEIGLACLSVFSIIFVIIMIWV